MKLQHKIPLFVVAVMIFAGLLGAVALLSTQRSTSTKMFEDTTATLTDTILNGLEQDMLRGDRGHVQKILDDLKQHESIRSVDIISTDGRIWASSDHGTIGTEVDPGITSFISVGTGREVLGHSSDENMTDVAAITTKDQCLSCHGQIAPSPNQAGNLGGLRVDISTVTLQESLAKSRELLLIIGGLTFFLVAGTIVLLLRLTVLWPLKKLTMASDRIASGDYDARVPVKKRDDELGTVSAAFNEMADTIDERTKRLQSANRELEQANRLKSEFLANMSHELRTPLNIIIGFAEVLRDTPSDQLDDADRVRFGDNIASSGHHLLSLINDVLDLAKVEAGQMQTNPAEFHIETVLDDVVSTMKTLAQKKNIELAVAASQDLDNIFADIAKFKQIMYNLISNAIKFTPDKGTVSIEASVVNNMARFSVKDTGVGIAAADQERIFAEFQQADGSPARQYEGTGLGLALTKKFVELQGGEIWVESEVGTGSTFHFTLPLGRSNSEKSPLR